MHYLVKQLLNNEAVLALWKKQNTLGNLSICEEALLYSALYAKEPKQILYKEWSVRSGYCRRHTRYYR